MTVSTPSREDTRLTIGALARATGTSHRQLRHYESQGLIRAQRTAGGHRLFSSADVETVRRIRVLLDAGLPLRLVEQVLPCFDDAGARLDRCVADLLQEHARRLDQQLGDLARQQRATLELLPL